MIQGRKVVRKGKLHIVVMLVCALSFGVCQPVFATSSTEIQEELDTEVEVGDLLGTVEYDYPTFHLSMQCFLCKIKSGSLNLKEHEAARWLAEDELDSVDWLPADIEVLEWIRREIF